MSTVTNPAYQAINTEQSSACDCSDARTVIPPPSDDSHRKHHLQHNTNHLHQNNRRRQNGAKLLNCYSYRKPQNITHNKINYINSQLHSVNSYSKQHVSSECSLWAIGFSEPMSVLSAFIVWSISFTGTWCKMRTALPQWTKVFGFMFAVLLCSGSVGARPNSSVPTTTTATVAPVPIAAALTRAAQPPQVESSVS